MRERERDEERVRERRRESEIETGRGTVRERDGAVAPWGSVALCHVPCLKWRLRRLKFAGSAQSD